MLNIKTLVKASAVQQRIKWAKQLSDADAKQLQY
jgi:hypothetical protein